VKKTVIEVTVPFLAAGVASLPIFGLICQWSRSPDVIYCKKM